MDGKDIILGCHTCYPHAIIYMYIYNKTIYILFYLFRNYYTVSSCLNKTFLILLIGDEESNDMEERKICSKLHSLQAVQLSQQFAKLCRYLLPPEMNARFTVLGGKPVIRTCWMDGTVPYIRQNPGPTATRKQAWMLLKFKRLVTKS